MTETLDCEDCKWSETHQNGVMICTHRLTGLKERGSMFNVAAIQPNCETARLPLNICGIIARLFEKRTTEPPNEK